jgi:hypothetical protein
MNIENNVTMVAALAIEQMVNVLTSGSTPSGMTRRVSRALRHKLELI